MSGLTWGAFVPHGGAGEFEGWSPTDAWSRMSAYATALDDLGYDHVWVSDHLMASGGDRTSPYFEAYTAMAALGQVTSRARLGALVTCALYRNAGMLAKQAANVDVTSGGRLIFALGGGWDEPEFDAYGYDFPSPGARVTAFAETLESVRRLWSEPKVDFDGTYVQLRGASCNPRPAAMPPIWTGTHGPKGLRVAARFADVANWNCGIDDFRRLSTELGEACVDVGRDPATIDTSVYRLADLSPGGEALTTLLQQLGAPPEAAETLRAQHFVGEPEDVARSVQEFVDAGARHVIAMFLDATTSTVSAERFLGEVVPRIRDPRG